MGLGRSLKINLLSSWGAQLLMMLIGAFLMPYILNAIGDVHYGIWIFISAAAGYSKLLNMGFGATISRFVAKYQAQGDSDKMNRIVNAILGVYLIMGLAALLIAGFFAILAPHIDIWDGESITEIRWVIMILGINIAVGLAGSVFGGVLMGIQRFDLERAISVSTSVLRVILIVLFLQTEFALLTLALVFLVMTLVENIGHIYYAFKTVRTLRVGVRYFEWKTLRDSWSFSGYSFLDDVAHHFIYLADTIVIGLLMTSQKMIVPYFIALRICQFVNKPVQQVGMVAMPRAGELHENSESGELQKLVTRGMEWTFLMIAGIFVGAIFFGQTLIDTWVGEGYEQSYLILIILLGAQVVANPLLLIRSILFGMGNVKIPAILYTFEAIFNLILSVILIQYYGLIGVALGTLIPIIVIEIGMLFPYAIRTLKLHWGKLLFRTVIVNLIPLVALAIYSYYVDKFNPWHTGGISYIRIGSWSLLEGIPAQHVRNWFGLLAISLCGGGLMIAVKLATMKIEKMMTAKGFISISISQSKEGEMPS